MLYNDNPFKLLGVSPADSRREIMRQAEEKALLLDSQSCADARTILTNPQRRITAEVRWFLDCSKEEIAEIDRCISETLSGKPNDDFLWDQYCPLTQLNIQLTCLDAQDFANPSLAKFYILGISRLFESIDAESVRLLINEKRQQAGFPEVSKSQDIEPALSELRSEIRQAFSQKLQKLPQTGYNQIVTLLSESYSGNQRYKGHAVLEDIISEYQLYINDTLTKQGQTITKTAKFIAQGAKKIDVAKAVQDLIASLYAWDKLAQPLQLGALTKGSSHEASREMLVSLRELALKLHNDFGMSAESLAITKATQDVFKELPEFIDLLNNDSKTLSRLIEEKEAEDVLSPILDTINAAYDELINCPEAQRQGKLNKLINAEKNADQQIRLQYSDRSTADSLRTSLGLLVRSFAVDLHNDHQRTADALSLITAIEPVFSDLHEVEEKIAEDKETLSGLKREQDNSDRIIGGLKEIEILAEGVKSAPIGDRSGKINTLITKFVELDKLIKSCVSKSDMRDQVRERLAYLVRSVGIELHNTKKDSDNALRVIAAVKNEFSDMPKMIGVLNNDISTLNTQIALKKAAAERQRQQEESQKTKRIVWLVIAAVILIIIAVSSCNSGSSSSSSSKSTSYSSTSSYSSTTTPKPTATLTPQTMPANGKVFYCSTTDRPSSFKVTNSGSSNYYMKFVKAGTNTKVITFFVRAYSTVEIDMPAGNFELRYAYGSTWYGESKLFGENTGYAKDEEYYDFSNYTWEISLYTTSNAGESMDVEYIDANEF